MEETEKVRQSKRWWVRTDPEREGPMFLRKLPSVGPTIGRNIICPQSNKEW